MGAQGKPISRAAARTLVEWAVKEHQKRYPMYRPGLVPDQDEVVSAMAMVWESLHKDTPFPMDRPKGKK